ncbi:hypothetical protein MMC34_001653 [Xylographa carneopallida]|nr:hypothetical protein [Xylographa carneopallida]
MNEVSAKCGCKFSFCNKKAALIQWADGSRQNVWRNSASSRVDTIWGKRHPPDLRGEEGAGDSARADPEAEETGNLKRKASTEFPLDHERAATKGPEEPLTEDLYIQNSGEIDPQLLIPLDADITSREDPNEQQIYGDDSNRMTESYRNLTMTQDPRFGEHYEFSEEAGRARVQNHFIDDENHDPSLLNDGWFNEWLDDWVAEIFGGGSYPAADSPNADFYVREEEGGQGEDARRLQRRKKGKRSCWRQLLEIWNRPSSSDEVTIIEEFVNDEEPYITHRHPADSQSLASGQTTETEPSPTSSIDHYQVGGQPRSTTTQNDTGTGSSSPLGSIESHMTHPKPSEAWPPGAEGEADTSNQRAPGQRRFASLRVRTNNGRPVRSHGRRYTDVDGPSTGPTFGRRETARPTHQPQVPNVRNRHIYVNAPRGGHPMYRPGSFERRRAQRRGDLMIPPLHGGRQLGRRSRDRGFQRDNGIIPLPWLRQSRIAYIAGFASFLLILVLMNSVSWPQLLLIFILEFAAIWLMED